MCWSSQCHLACLWPEGASQTVLPGTNFVDCHNHHHHHFASWCIKFEIQCGLSLKDQTIFKTSFLTLTPTTVLTGITNHACSSLAHYRQMLTHFCLCCFPDDRSIDQSNTAQTMQTATWRNEVLRMSTEMLACHTWTWPPVMMTEMILPTLHEFVDDYLNLFCHWTGAHKIVFFFLDSYILIYVLMVILSVH